MGRLKTNDEFISDMKEIHPEIIFLDEYTTNRNKIHSKCAKCGHEWFPFPFNLYKGCGCPKCAGKAKITHEQFVKKIKEIHPQLEIIGHYKNHKSIIEYKCNQCGMTHKAKALHLLNGHGCPYCCGRYRIEGVNDLATLRPDLVKYFVNSEICKSVSLHSSRKVKLKCDKCDYITEMSVEHFVSRGFHCPFCNNTSNGEKQICDYLLNNKIDFTPRKTFSLLKGMGNKRLSYDFYLPDYNLLIEFQGKQHYKSVDYFGGDESFKIQQEHDRRKRQYAKINNYYLLEIPYWNYQDIDTMLDYTLQNIENCI